jgi:pimeloyl-ACP methyl ester carboxylesterase
VEVKGIRLHIVVLGLAPGSSGADPPVVLIHGASGNAEDMRLAIGDRLAESHRVIIIDRPGHSWSSRPGGDLYATPASQAELVAGVLEKLGVRSAILIGHSWGGALAMAYTLAFPRRTAGLVLLSAVTHPWRGNPGWYNKLACVPYIGALFLRTCVYPLGFLMTKDALQGVRTAAGPDGLHRPRGDPIGTTAENVLRQRPRPLTPRKLHLRASAALR